MEKASKDSSRPKASPGDNIKENLNNSFSDASDDEGEQDLKSMPLPPANRRGGVLGALPPVSSKELDDLKAKK